MRPGANAVIVCRDGRKYHVTDLAPDAAATKAWLDTAQHTRTLEEAYKPGLIDEETFRRRVTLKSVDMNAIPEELDAKYDFCWSICALEHLGSVQHGLDFIENSLRVLKPGRGRGAYHRIQLHGPKRGA